MSDGSKLVQTFQKIAKVPEQEHAGIVIGNVTSTSPLRIKVGDKLELTESFLILSPFVQEVVIEVWQPGAIAPGHAHGVPSNGMAYETSTSAADSHFHMVPAVGTTNGLTSMVLWRGLFTGDVVYMLRVDKGQKYYVLQKEGGIGI